MNTPAGLAATPLGKAAGIVRDYVLRMYYVVDEVPRRQRLRLTPLLLGVEYLVYRVDSLAERNAAVDLDAVRGSDYEAFHTYKKAFEKVLRLLRAWNDDVAFLVDEAERFIRLENGTTSRGTVARDDILAMVELRPTDVRLLRAMTFALRGRAMDPATRDLLWPVEVLADIANDLRHYEQDVAAGTLNVYAAFVKLFGDAAASELRREVDRYEAMFLERLSALPPERRARVADVCRRRYAEAVGPYPRTAGHRPAPAPAPASPSGTALRKGVAVGGALTVGVLAAVAYRRGRTPPVSQTSIPLPPHIERGRTS
ncbi:hypothetical protein [Streptomyces parvulus]|uniref:Squalene/phytoene synthase family protein n=1 Tax=Streptomyces parvulus TaxID=146923 RepID=A0A369VAX5_9ACTN|nr:hypothetical protein [Streptomyces parvulus]RDD89941.1 hypothetical protein DVZ84_07910 [Streptomyces parvulus]